MPYDPIDVNVGSRIRLCRRALKISQEALARQVGVTFQQIQKYESGANRVSCSMLWKIAEKLQEPIAYFFEGLEGTATKGGVGTRFEREAVVAAMTVPALINVPLLNNRQQAVLSDLIETMIPAPAPKKAKATVRA